MKQTVCVIAAHPDDEVLGCGGTLAKHVIQGDSVHVFIAAEGVTARDAIRDIHRRQHELIELKNSAYKANECLGVQSVTFGNFPDNRMDSMERLVIIKSIEEYLKPLNPTIIYTHHSSDINIDHQRVHEAVITACRALPHSHLKRLLFFEVLSNTEWQVSGSQKFFHPNWYVDISQTLEKKLHALRAYYSELCDWPHPRSIRGVEALAAWRGCSVGVDAAEAFVLGRYIDS
ncbi:MAG: GlcNAc-PI de-N-acetylase [Gammaproteobacteria bacterium RIFCSPHIGHO2_12_FULL_41_15]|nr:MAG: GlcNAc-PI de-N-acetylase [Gammaproteobacteria bacterium RIFCSPHIGHO2_12_FULL_41_15]